MEFENWWNQQTLWNPRSEAAKDVAYSGWHAALETQKAAREKREPFIVGGLGAP